MMTFLIEKWELDAFCAQHNARMVELGGRTTLFAHNSIISTPFTVHWYGALQMNEQGLTAYGDTQLLEELHTFLLAQRVLL